MSTTTSTTVTIPHDTPDRTSSCSECETAAR